MTEVAEILKWTLQQMEECVGFLSEQRENLCERLGSDNPRPRKKNAFEGLKTPFSTAFFLPQKSWSEVDRGPTEQRQPHKMKPTAEVTIDSISLHTASFSRNKCLRVFTDRCPCHESRAKTPVWKTTDRALPSVKK